jgi:ferredoxin
MDDKNKAVLAKEIYCDGLGACLDVCPTGALTVTEKESAEYDPQASYQHVLQTRGAEAASQVHGADEIKQPKVNLACGPAGEASAKTGCPGTMAREISRSDQHLSQTGAADQVRESIPSELSQWPIQLHLISPAAPYFNEVDLLIAADCTAFTMGSFHRELLKGKKLVIACPKLDRTDTYVDKLTELIKNNTIYSITVAMMTVPCCTGLGMMVEQAVEHSGKNIAVKKVIVDLEGRIK